jgi:molecular chaperone HtpG
MERLLRHTHGEDAVPRQKRLLEVNPRHEIVRRLVELASRDEATPTVERYARLLLDFAVLAEGSEPTDPAGLRRRFAELMLAGLAGGAASPEASSRGGEAGAERAGDSAAGDGEGGPGSDVQEARETVGKDEEE